MFTVNFYNFEKRNNSTKRPTSGAVSYDCVVLDGTGILNPSIVLDIGLTANPSNYNYAYISDFGRYYWIREWSFDSGLWIASMSVDVLATYKTEIGSSGLYILRAANAYDGNIIDGLYPTKTNCEYHTDLITQPYDTGCYVIGCVSKIGAYGSIAYYVMDSSNMARFVQGLMDDTVTSTNGFDVNDASMALQLSLVDPIQYIKSVMWCPFAMADLTYTQASQLQIFDWTLSNVTCGLIYGKTVKKTYTFDLTKHPDSSSRGNYVNCSPYTNLTLNFPPYGNITIDTTVTSTATEITIELDYDIFTGSGQLRVVCNGIVLNQINTQLGVPVQISQVTRDYLGAANNALSAVGSVAGSVGSFAAGNIAGGVSGVAGAAQGIINAAASMIPRANTIGGSGNYSVLNYQPRLDYQFFRPVADDPARNGRPLCQIRTPASLGGYMLIQDGDVTTDGTSNEDDMIRGYLESGFYYE